MDLGDLKAALEKELGIDAPTVTHDGEGVTTVAKTCPFCRERVLIVMMTVSYDRWQSGEHVQDVWPDWLPAERETLISGCHPDCFADNMSWEDR
jgi:hypothetical protein